MLNAEFLTRNPKLETDFMTPLSNEQKANLCMLAQSAWAAWAGREDWCADHRDQVNDPLLSEAKCLEAWRRAEQFRAVGVASLREATSEQHYLRLRAHFENHLGNSGRAVKTLLRHEDEPKVRALKLIEHSCVQRGLPFPNYPAAICRRQYKCALGDATEKQLWSINFTVRNRRTAQGEKYPSGKFAAKPPAARTAFAAVPADIFAN
jgi:hypothetical protein